MTTKYILSGGCANVAPDKGKAFYTELLAGKERLLIVPFASDSFGRWLERPRLIDFYTAVVRRWELAHSLRLEISWLTGIQPSIQVARLHRFEQQLCWADAIYFTGGTTVKLLDVLSNRYGWRYELRGKNIAGDSAGANALACWCYGLDAGKFLIGTGQVPVKVIIHYESGYLGPDFQWGKLYQYMNKQVAPNLPLLALHEGEFRVVKV